MISDMNGFNRGRSDIPKSSNVRRFVNNVVIQLQTWLEWLYVNMDGVTLSVRVMILLRGSFKVVAYQAASQATNVTHTSSLRNDHYRVPSPVKHLHSGISAHNGTMANNPRSKNMFDGGPADKMHANTPPPLDCWLNIVKSLPGTFLQVKIQTMTERTKQLWYCITPIPFLYNHSFAQLL